jgi:hypothetical protein
LATVGARPLPPLPVRGLPALPQAGGPEGRQLQAACRVGRHGTLEQLHAADAVDQRVVHLDVEREALALQPLDQRAFPGRARQVQRRAVQAADQLAQLALATRPGQRGMAYVVLEVDVVVLDPARQRVLGKRRLQPPVPGRRKFAVMAEVVHQAAQPVARRTRRQAELQQAAHVVGRGTRFGEQPGGIERVQAHGVHRAASGCHGTGGTLGRGGRRPVGFPD